MFLFLFFCWRRGLRQSQRTNQIAAEAQQVLESLQRGAFRPSHIRAPKKIFFLLGGLFYIVQRRQETVDLNATRYVVRQQTNPCPLA